MSDSKMRKEELMAQIESLREKLEAAKKTGAAQHNLPETAPAPEEVQTAPEPVPEPVAEMVPEPVAEPVAEMVPEPVPAPVPETQIIPEPVSDQAEKKPSDTLESLKADLAELEVKAAEDKPAEPVVPETIPQPVTEQVPEAAPAPEAKPAETVPAAGAQAAPAAVSAAELLGQGQKKKKKMPKGLLIALIAVAAVVLLAILLTQVFFGFMRVDDAGMEDTIDEGTLICYNRMAKDPDVGNIIVIRDKDGDKHVRYVAGLDGDELDYDDFEGSIYINDDATVDDFTPAMDDEITFPYVIGSSEVLVLNENRDDPEYEGIYKKKNIAGKIIFTF